MVVMKCDYGSTVCDPEFLLESGLGLSSVVRSNELPCRRRERWDVSLSWRVSLFLVVQAQYTIVARKGNHLSGSQRPLRHSDTRMSATGLSGTILRNRDFRRRASLRPLISKQLSPRVPSRCDPRRLRLEAYGNEWKKRPSRRQPLERPSKCLLVRQRRFQLHKWFWMPVNGVTLWRRETDRNNGKMHRNLALLALHHVQPQFPTLIIATENASTWNART